MKTCRAIDVCKRTNLLSVWRFLLVFSSCYHSGCSEYYESVQWTPQNPMFHFSNEMIREYRLSVLQNNKLIFICPNPSTYLNDIQKPISLDQMYENLWYVDKQSFQACTVGGHKVKGINSRLLECKNPRSLSYRELVFQRFSVVTPLSFLPGTEHYFIATSNGSKSSLNSTSGGHCNDVANGISMKMIIYICKSDEDLWHLLAIIFAVALACSLVLHSISLFLVCRSKTDKKTADEKLKLHQRTGQNETIDKYSIYKQQEKYDTDKHTLSKEVDRGREKVRSLRQKILPRDPPIAAEKNGDRDMGVVSLHILYSLQANIGKLERVRDRLNEEVQRLEREKATLSSMNTEASNKVAQLTSENKALKTHKKKLVEEVHKQRDELRSTFKSFLNRKQNIDNRVGAGLFKA